MIRGTARRGFPGDSPASQVKGKIKKGIADTQQWGRLVALWLCYFQGLGFSMSLTMVSSNVAGYTKKQLTAAVLFTGYCIGNIIGPQTFISTEKRKSKALLE